MRGASVEKGVRFLKDKDFRLVLVPLLSSLLISSGACSNQDDEYSSVCVDRTTGERVEDDRCSPGYRGHGAGAFYAWYFLSGGGGRSGFVPPVGSPARGGTFETPPGYDSVTGKPSSSVRRGGFGSSSRGKVGG